MPAKSKAQQKLMGMVHATQTGQIKAPSEKVAKLAKSMTKKSAGDYASTKHKGLPKKAKKESIKENMEYENKVGQLYVVQKPSAGCDMAGMVYEVDPITGIQPHGVDAQTVHGVYASMEEAQKVAEKLYDGHMTGMKKLEEKKGKVTDKLTKTISNLEKKHKSMMEMAKANPKEASMHKSKISEIQAKIQELMDKLEKVEKSKKPIEEKEEDKKSLKENVGNELFDKVLKFVETNEDFKKIKKDVRVSDRIKEGFIEVRYGYWDRLPQPYEQILFDNFEYNVEDYWDDEKGSIEYYKVTEEKPFGTRLENFINRKFPNENIKVESPGKKSAVIVYNRGKQMDGEHEKTFETEFNIYPHAPEGSGQQTWYYTIETK